MTLSRLTKNALYVANNCVTSKNIPASQARKIIKEISPCKRKFLIDTLKNPHSSDSSKIETLDQELEDLINNDTAYKRRTNWQFSIIRGIKNKFFSRTSSEKLIKEILKHRDQLPSPSIAISNSHMDTSIALPCQETRVQLLGNLSQVILEKGLYLNEGFFRIPGSMNGVKKLHVGLLAACNNDIALSTQDITKIAEKISMDPDVFAGVFKRMARDLLESESQSYVNYNAGLSSYTNPMDFDESHPEPKNLKEILLANPCVHENIMTLLRAVTENEDVTLLNEGSLMVAFPACRSLFT